MSRKLTEEVKTTKSYHLIASSDMRTFVIAFQLVLLVVMLIMKIHTVNCSTCECIQNEVRTTECCDRVKGTKVEQTPKKCKLPPQINTRTFMACCNPQNEHKEDDQFIDTKQGKC